MSKAILILDMPINCKNCSLSEMSYDFNKILCVPMQESYDKFAKQKPDWCPLREIPKKNKENYYPDEYMDGYGDGWNACIDEILGE